VQQNPIKRVCVLAEHLRDPHFALWGFESKDAFRVFICQQLVMLYNDLTVWVVDYRTTWVKRNLLDAWLLVLVPTALKLLFGTMVHTPAVNENFQAKLLGEYTGKSWKTRLLELIGQDMIFDCLQYCQRHITAPQEGDWTKGRP